MQSLNLQSEKVVQRKVFSISFKSKKAKIILASVLLTLVLASGGVGFWQYKKYSSPQMQNERDVQETITKIGKLFALPEDEAPTLATVTDKEKIKDQPFFLRAENGDKVLFYTRFGRAILYRPSEDKIIDVTVIKTVNPNSATNSAQP